VDADNGMGLTPLMFAAMFGRTRVVAQLQAHGASLQRRNRLGLSRQLHAPPGAWPGPLAARGGELAFAANQIKSPGQPRRVAGRYSSLVNHHF